MAKVSYCKPGLVLRRGGPASQARVRALQTDLRALGYLAKGIDGQFGRGTELAVKALQYDLLHNDGGSRHGADGKAAVCLLDCNRGRVVDIDGRVDQQLARVIGELLKNPEVGKLPQADNPGEENDRLAEAIRELPSDLVPTPFLVAMLRQESNLQHYRVPRGRDQDSFITVGLDRNGDEPHIITSRGYGLGQYTLFHHPPSPQEVDDFMLDVRRNLQRSVQLFRDKFMGFVNGNTSGTRADDRIKEIGKGPLRPCRYSPSDERYMKNCRYCAQQVAGLEIRENETPLFKGSRHVYKKTRYYRTANYRGVPDRRTLGCDWPYAARRYNGAGVNSYHYQTRVLKNLLK